MAELGFHAEWQSDWGCPYPFRVAVLQSEHDADLGQWSITLALLGLSVTLVWEYADTPLKTRLRDMMADESWLKDSHVSLPFADYDALKADAEKWRESQCES